MNRQQIGQINKAIAEWCGWVDVKPSGRLDGQMVGVNPGLPVVGVRREIPDYYHDLNAIREAELKLEYGQGGRYVEELVGLVRSKGGWSLRALATASAPQRCEALLRTIGKWEEASVEE